MKKKDIINILILMFVFGFILFLKIGFKHINGSTVDFVSQHSVFPDYFRMLFYNTKNILPSFAFNIGAGENIFNFSYYGFLSPMTLLSYLFPFIKMIDFIQIYMILSTILSIIFIYYFLRKKYDENYSFVGSLLFLVSGPLIFQTARHIMFINYMPFLLLSLISADIYFEKNKKSPLILFVFLLIMSSYYYSIPSIICIILYSIYEYIERNEFDFKKIIKYEIKLISLIIVSIMISMVLLLPTLYAIKNGRADITEKVNLISTLIPKFNITETLYNAYSIGTTSIILIAIIYGYFNKNKKILSIVFLLLIIFPIFMYSLNGFMYVRGKVLIPLLPIAILLITDFLNNYNCKKNKLIELLVVIVLSISIVSFIINKLYIFIIEIVLLFIFYFLSIKTQNKKYLLYYVIISSIVCCLINNSLDILVKKTDIRKNDNYNLNEFNKDSNYRVSNLSMDKLNGVEYNNYLSTVYSSLENGYYYNFYNNKIYNENSYNISTAISSKNILFNTLMSTKYIISDNDVLDYEKINDNLYINSNVLPIGFFTDRILNYETYSNLSDEEKAFSLVTNVIVNDGIKDYQTKVNSIKLEYDIVDTNVKLEKSDNKYIIDNKDEGYIKLKIEPLNDKLLFISFDMEYVEDCAIGDTSVTINGIKNTLSCKTWAYPNNNNNFRYVINEKELIDLNILFDKGKYVISNIKTYIVDYNYILDFVNSVSKFNINREETKGDRITGDLYAYDDGYFMISIPYDKGFNILVDNEKTDYKLANESFIAFPLNKGNHSIEITYEAPLLKEGKIISIIGFLLFIYNICLDLKKDKVKI